MKQQLFVAFFLGFISFSTLNAQTVTGDPWIFQAYKELYNRQPNALEINMKNYNSGAWNSYNELKKYVQEFQTSLQHGIITISIAYVNDVAVIGIRQNGQQVAVAAVSLNGGRILAHDGASILSGSAGSIVGTAGGNLTSLDGSGIAVNKNMGGIGFGSYNTTQSETIKVVRSGKGALIINKKT